MKDVSKTIGLSVVGFLLFLTLCMSFKVIRTGEVGVFVRMGEVTQRVTTEGINFKVPWIEKIVIMNVKVQKSEAEVAAATKDLQDITAKFAINYQIEKSEARNLYSKVGLDYLEVLVNPVIQDAFKSATAKYTAEEIITKRNEVSDVVIKFLKEKLSPYGINIVDLNIVNVDFSAEFNKAIEAKQIAEQNAKRARLELETTKAEAEKKVTAAKAEAEAMRLQKSNASAKYVELQRIEAQKAAIEKWNGQLPTTMSGGAIPFLNIK